MPVSNLSVFGAVGSKPTTIKQQVQLSIKIGIQQVEFPFLVVQGLSTDVIVGTDWQAKFKMIIDLENQMIKFNGEYVPENRIIYMTKGGENVPRACKMMKVGGEMWYKGFEEVAEINKGQEQSPVETEACRLRKHVQDGGRVY